MRIAAAVALGKIGPLAREALPKLREQMTVRLGVGTDRKTQRLDIREIHKLSFDRAAQAAIDAIEGESK